MQTVASATADFPYISFIERVRDTRFVRSFAGRGHPISAFEQVMSTSSQLAKRLYIHRETVPPFSSGFPPPAKARTSGPYISFL
ncbi:hypothetical protein [Burkholderia vietnamiensis]|uniref:hypothetical protein n=1 Tax=Burkholderia vietnamiensis TaxID=60552 RepID=UPI00264EBF23|nr:hypothetical protein [Burkholderia vietnamiensis]MDN7818133.1 hypothetical protein [Burkholderia vietnamiensis]